MATGLLVQVEGGECGGLLKTVDEDELDAGKGHRPRKKNKYEQIMKQLEFYLSDSNLAKDRFLGQKMRESRELPLDTFLTFNKIKSITTDVKDLVVALKNSTILVLSADETKVSRKSAPSKRGNEDECTIYVENIPIDAHHEWLQSIFASYGNILYVSIPKFKNKQNKGFAFIEFDSPNCVTKVLEAFGSAGCRLSSQMPSEQLLSIKTFEDDGGKALYLAGRKMQDVLPLMPPRPVDIKTMETPVGKRKRPSESDELTPEAKKMKADEESPEMKGENLNQSGSSESKIASDEEDSMDAESGDEDGNDDKRKKARNRKNKKAKKKEHLEVAALGLRILSKQEWKRLRNKYLNLQREKMSTLKKQLHEARIAEAKAKQEEAKTKETNGKSVPSYTFTPGVILKIAMQQPVMDMKQFKTDARAKDGVAYVDIVPDRLDVYIRCENAEAAQSLLSSQAWPDLSVLEGDQEKEYWDRIQQEREAKFKEGRKKVRGRDKLLAKAKHTKFLYKEEDEVENTNTQSGTPAPPPQNQHIRFADDDDEKEATPAEAVVVSVEPTAPDSSEKNEETPLATV